MVAKFSEVFSLPFFSLRQILQHVKDLNITYAQGFHTGKPQFLNH
jgi:hypothetical protein